MSNSKQISNVLNLINKNLQKIQDPLKIFKKKSKLKKKIFIIICDALSDAKNLFYDMKSILNHVNLIIIFKIIYLKSIKFDFIKHYKPMEKKFKSRSENI